MIFVPLKLNIMKRNLFALLSEHPSYIFKDDKKLTTFKSGCNATTMGYIFVQKKTLIFVRKEK